MTPKQAVAKLIRVSWHDNAGSAMMDSEDKSDAVVVRRSGLNGAADQFGAVDAEAAEVLEQNYPDRYEVIG